MKRVYGFNEGGKELIDILGGKGGNLAEMKRIGLPIPEGIIVSTTACKEFFRDGKKITPELEKEIHEKLEYLQEVTGKKFEGDNPLLVSVRSGAPISMPGMMDTILNLGLNDITAEKMSKIFNDEIFVHELYARFIQMFSEIVMGIEKELFFSLKEKLFAERKDEPKIETYKLVIKKSKELYKEKTGLDFPESAKEQLFMAVNAIFNSWENDRAILYRKINGIDDSMGTAVVIQEMVFGNRNDKSGTGVAFSRNPSNGENELFGEYLLKAQGEDIVAGIRTPEPIARLHEQLPEIYDEFARLAKVL